MNKKQLLKAALLNAFVLPGLGQLLLGHKVKGFVCIMLINMLLLAALFVVLKTISPIVAAQIAAGNQIDSTVSAVTEAIEQGSNLGKLLLGSIVFVWVYALVDVFRCDTPIE